METVKVTWTKYVLNKNFWKLLEYYLTMPIIIIIIKKNLEFSYF